MWLVEWVSGSIFKLSKAFLCHVQRFTELEYLILGLVSTVPAFLIPLFLVGKVNK